jgi:hypothetical protein
VLATVAAAHTRGLVAAGTGRATALTEGYRLAFGIGAGLILTSLLVAVAVFRGGLPHPEAAHPHELAMSES